MTRVAVFDCGTNTTRCLVADVSGTELKTLLRTDRITQLGRGVDVNRALDSDAVDRTISALTEFAEKADELGADARMLFATSACRDATNSSDFMAAAKIATGVEPVILTGNDEGTMTFLGATAEREAGKTSTVIDIGGGSTEYSFGINGKEPTAVVSIDFGALRVTERFLNADPPSPLELSQAVSVVRDELEQLLRDHPEFAEADECIAVAGTATTAAAIEIGLEPYDPTKVHDFQLTKEAIEDVFRTLATENLEQRKLNPGLQPERADVVVGGMIMLAVSIRQLGYEYFRVSESDILDGAAYSLATK